MIELYTRDLTGVTLVPNAFIDEHMFEANGEFVKLYLYLLRTISMPRRQFTISSLADEISFTENDIMRALKYWERFNYLSLEYDENGARCRISLMPNGQSPAVPVASAPAVAVSPVSDISGRTGAIMAMPEPKIAPAVASEPVMRHYTADELDAFKNDPGASEIIFITEKYINKTLTQSDVETILFWHDELKLPYDLIEHLVESCVDSNHKSFHYMNAIAVKWASQGITSVDMAKQSASIHSQAHYSIMKYMGITGRDLVPSEEAFVEKWTNEYCFAMDVISEACKRTVTNTGKPSFQYADKILGEWFKAGVHHSEDIAELDAKKPVRYTAQATSKPVSQNFTGRDYDYAKLEAQLLGTGES